MTLGDLRNQVTSSYAWRYKGKVVTRAYRDALPDKEQAKCRYESDPALLAALVAAEKSETERLWEARTGPPESSSRRVP